MADYIRLRQICLVAPRLASAISVISKIMGLDVCYRDDHVAKYGLENAVMPVGTILLEVVAPFTMGSHTAAGRFIEKMAGRGGYMAIFCCENPEARSAKANGMGVRTVKVVRDYALYRSVHLHPRDCRAAFIVFNHTDGGDPDPLGPYPPAGPDWQKSIRKDTTLALTEVEIRGPEPEALAAHWGKIVGLPADGDTLKLPNCTFRFVKGDEEIMSGLTFKVTDKAKTLAMAILHGCEVRGDQFDLCGVTFKLVS